MNEVVNDDNTAATNEDAFLVLLDQDISVHPERFQPIDVGLVPRVRSLVGDVAVELDVRLPPDGA